MRNWIDVITESFRDEDAEYDKEVFGRGCWVLPDGEVVWTDYEGDVHHGDIASEHFTPKDGEDFVEAAVDAGWLRLRWQEGGMFCLEVAPGIVYRAGALREVRTLAMNSGAARFVLEYPGGHTETHDMGSLMVALSRYVDRNKAG